MNSSSQYFGERAASKPSLKRVLNGLNIPRHPEGAEQNPQSFCYCDALMNIPVIAGMIRNCRIGERCRIGAVDSTQKAAFTLSEVLITLGIIGVVAAIVMPILIQKIDDRVNITKWKKAYATVSQAYYKVKNDDVTICDRKDIYMCQYTSEFIEEFRKALNPVAMCPRTAAPYTGCNMTSGPYTGRFKTLKGGEVSAYNYSGMQYLLKDGTVVLLGGTHGGPWITVDVNGKNPPNTLGKDVFVMKVVIKENPYQPKPANYIDRNLIVLGQPGYFSVAANGEECLCGKEYGLETANYYAHAQGAGEIASGGCCSYQYLFNK